MARRVFFSFEYGDVSRAMVVRNSWVTQTREAAGFTDAAAFEKLKLQGDAAVQRWINNQMNGTSVTVVLVGQNTCTSKWVRYEVNKSIEDRMGLLAIDISKIKDLNGRTTDRCGRVVPQRYPLYLWNNQNGYQNMGNWIEEAARKAGR